MASLALALALLLVPACSGPSEIQSRIDTAIDTAIDKRVEDKTTEIPVRVDRDEMPIAAWTKWSDVERLEYCQMIVRRESSDVSPADLWLAMKKSFDETKTDYGTVKTWTLIMLALLEDE